MTPRPSSLDLLKSAEQTNFKSFVRANVKPTWPFTIRKKEILQIFANFSILLLLSPCSLPVVMYVMISWWLLIDVRLYIQLYGTVSFLLLACYQFPLLLMTQMTSHSLILTSYLSNCGQNLSSLDGPQDAGILAAIICSVSWDCFQASISLEKHINRAIFNRILTRNMIRVVKR